MNSRVLNGTAAGMLLSMAGLLPWQDMARTVLLAALGAAVSFGITLLLQWLGRRKNKQN